jgi:hypothetical protein
VAALLAGVLLLALVQVLREGGRASDVRRQAVAEHAEATWRCKAERLQPLRQDCLARLTPSPRPGAAPRSAPALQRLRQAA